MAGTGYAVTHTWHGDDKHQLAADFRMKYDEAAPLDRSGYIREACDVIAAYLWGTSKRVDLAVQLDGNAFERKVWHELRRIPYGKTLGYGDIAKAIGSAESFSAVAEACLKNPVPLIIPCHRAVRQNGDAGGFIWGDEAKKFLLGLEHERALSESED